MKFTHVLKSAVLVGFAALSLTACKENAKDYSGVYERQDGDFIYTTELEKTQKDDHYVERYSSKRTNGTPISTNNVRTVKIENDEVYELSGHLRAKMTDTTYTQINNGNVYTKVVSQK